MDTIIQLAAGVGLQNSIGWFVPIYLGITNVLPTLLILYDYYDKSAEYNKNRVPLDSQITYDFIIVGSGSAGSVVANRLSENFNVLVLERGGDPNPLTSVPALESDILNRPETDYSYITVPQNTSCLSMNNRQSLWSRGIGLGGSSIVNSMVYLRGHPYDYDNWARITGDNRWSYQNILPYFLKSESYCFSCEPDVSATTNPSFHSVEGELFLTKSTYSPMVPEFLSAMEWSQVPRADLNAPFATGADSVVYTQKNGRRWTTRDAFIEPIRNRPTLKILKYATVNKVLFLKGRDNHAHGVEYDRFGEKHVAYASKEIILSAGAIDSAKILLLSGIGPRENLEPLKIPVRVDTPVGQNLQDHVGTFAGPFLIDRPVSFLPDRDLGQASIDEFLSNGTGPWTASFAHGVAFWPSSRAVKSGESLWPDIQIGFSPIGVYSTIDEDISRIYNIRPEVMKEFFDPIKGSDAFQMIVTFARPRSRGVLTLRSTDYADPPIIDPRYYTDEDGMDIRVIVEALKTAVKISENAPSFKKMAARLSPIAYPTCKDILFKSDAYWECVARAYTLTLYHFSGTVAMGPRSSPYSVVDSELRVIGTQGLRVIDASVFPSITTANTNAPSIMVGERGSQFVKEAWLNVKPHFVAAVHAQQKPPFSSKIIQNNNKLGLVEPLPIGHKEYYPV